MSEENRTEIRQEISKAEGVVKSAESLSTDTKTKKQRPLIIAAMAVILAMAVGIGIYNAPGSRLVEHILNNWTNYFYCDILIFVGGHEYVKITSTYHYTRRPEPA